ncbi:MAG: NADH-quinone oxidoreductase subunit NuoE [Anaerolineae bacterium]|nr:NADH-quinone oxidoreductase subunit NuoE [Anaerolineae bacterium]MDW8099541.1 NADH-quinone oxidoreductase subunit NuoE [Anaerolineae bacterium]
MSEQLEEILTRYARGDASQLIPALQQVQERFSYVSPEAVRQIARHLKVSESEVYGVASFYSQFRFEKPGKHTIKVCLGTACHVRRSDRLLEFFERTLNVTVGHTTADGLFSLERVACFGCCALSPVVVVDDEVHGRMTTAKAQRLLKKYGS